eukprot:EC096211.1.p2 GENE.EC096211.1~~EC096211.1.p2  ORF type:complete len:140 (-),score=3.97 EC096211.1:22-441(-)
MIIHTVETCAKFTHGDFHTRLINCSNKTKLFKIMTKQSWKQTIDKLLIRYKLFFGFTKVIKKELKRERFPEIFDELLQKQVQSVTFFSAIIINFLVKKFYIISAYNFFYTELMLVQVNHKEVQFIVGISTSSVPVVYCV